MLQFCKNSVAVPLQIAASIALEPQISSPWLQTQAATTSGLHASITAGKSIAKDAAGQHSKRVWTSAVSCALLLWRNQPPVNDSNLG